MAWVKIDDQFPDHPKILRIPIEAKPEALALQVLALCYSSRYLTDGKLEANVVQQLTSGFRHAALLPKMMLDAGIWDATDGGDGAYVIHDYLEYNPSKKQVLKLRSKRQAIGKQGGLRSGQARRKQVASRLLEPRPVPSPSPSATTPTPLVPPTGGPESNGVPDWLRDVLLRSEHFKHLAEAHGKFWRTMNTRFDPYEWLAWDEEVQKADVWLASNPNKAPTSRGSAKFLRNWFENAVEFGRKQRG